MLNAKYMASRPVPQYEILFTYENGMCAHEFIVDIRLFGQLAGIEVIGIA
jgi:glycine dehydrogenase